MKRVRQDDVKPDPLLISAGFLKKTEKYIDNVSEWLYHIVADNVSEYE